MCVGFFVFDLLSTTYILRFFFIWLFYLCCEPIALSIGSFTTCRWLGSLDFLHIRRKNIGVGQLLKFFFRYFLVFRYISLWLWFFERLLLLTVSTITPESTHYTIQIQWNARKIHMKWQHRSNENFSWIMRSSKLHFHLLTFFCTQLALAI